MKCILVAVLVVASACSGEPAAVQPVALQPEPISQRDFVKRWPSMLPTPSPSVSRTPSRASRSGSRKPVKVHAPPIARTQLERLALRAAAKYRIDARKFFRVIACESSWNPRAFNSCCHGLTAQHEDYWAARSAKAGYKGASIYDPEANLYTGAMLAAKGGWHHYDCG